MRWKAAGNIAKDVYDMICIYHNLKPNWWNRWKVKRKYNKKET